MARGTLQGILHGEEPLGELLDAAVLVEPIVQRLQRLDAGETGGAVGEPHRRVHGARRRGHREHVAAARHALLVARAGLGDELAEPRQLVEARRRQRLLEELGEGAGVAQQRLAAQHEVTVDVLLVVDLAALHRVGGDAARDRRLTRLGLEVVAPARAELGEEPRVGGEHRLELVVERGQLQRDVLVDDAVGALRVERDRGTVERRLASLGDVHRLGNVGEGDLRQDLRVVLLRLTLGEGRGTLDDATLLVAVERGLHQRQARRLGRGASLADVPIRAERERHAVRVVEQELAHQVLDEPRTGRVLAQTLERGIGVDRGESVAALHGGRQPAQHELQAERHAVAADLPLAELELVEHRLDVALGHAVRGDPLERLDDQFLDRLAVLETCPLETADEHHLAVAVVHAAEGGGAAGEVGALERVHQRRGAVVEQDAREEMGAQARVEIDALPEQPADDDVAALVEVLLARRVGLLDADRRVVAERGLDRDRAPERLEAGEHALVEAGLQLGGIDVAVGHEHRVRGVVVSAVELDQLLVGQVGDDLGIAAAVVVVGVVREEVLAERLPERAGRRAHRPLHLVEDDALEDEVGRRIVGLLELHAVAFLGEVELVQVREEHRVEVDVEEVEVILPVLARERVGGPVARGERVHERVQRAADHHEEGVAHRVALAAAEDGVLEDVGHAGRVLRHGAQPDEEDVLGVVGADVHVGGAGAGVPELVHVDVERGDVLAADVLEGFVGDRLVHRRVGLLGSGGGRRTRPRAV